MKDALLVAAVAVPETTYVEATALPLALRDLADVDRAAYVPSYGSVKTAMYSGRIPFERIGRKLVVRRENLPAIAAHYGLTGEAQAA